MNPALRVAVVADQRQAQGLAFTLKIDHAEGLDAQAIWRGARARRNTHQHKDRSA